ncbi:MAG: hypothetical protein P8177_09300 [Gemmatimonadota bacterium]
MHNAATRRVRAAKIAVTIAAATAAVTPLGATAQEPARVDSLRLEIARLQATVDSLARLIDRLQPPGTAPADTSPGDTTGGAPADPLAALRAAAAAAAAEGGGQPVEEDTTAGQVPTEFVGRQRNLQALNPEITVTGNLFAAVDFDDPEGDHFVPREFELGFQSNLDPYSRAKLFLGHHVPGAELVPFPGEEEEEHGGGVELEEGYIEWLGLPGGFNVVLGRFRQKFGQLNRWHPHALPAQTLPLPYTAFFGEEGLVQSGLSVHWLVPVSGFGAWELWTEVTRSGNESLFGESNRPSVLGHINGFWELSRSTYVELGFTGLAGPDMPGDRSFATRMGGTDFTLSWRPPERGRYRELTVRGGAVYGELAPESGNPGAAFGAFALAEMRLSQSWTVGGRYEYTEDPMDPAHSAWLAAPTLTWWQSEWVRLRGEVDFLTDGGGASRTLLVIQTTFAMGPHKHETY